MIWGVVSAVKVISAVRPVYAVLWLISAFLSVSAVFIFIGLVYMGFIMIIVYVGAIAILFLFVMMMLDQGKEEAGTPIVNIIPMGMIVGVGFLWVAATGGEWVGAYITQQNHSRGMIGGQPGGDIVAIGRVVYTEYSYMFIIVSYILLVAMVGAIVLTHRHGEYGPDEPMRQDVYIQTSRDIWGHPNQINLNSLGRYK
ncbi:NADH dehydrogenase subunit 6 (mitochondrion) [Amphimedon queenslandica]|uniref:NADH-ubiquinone oxidoreductase chain 6 n=1 Tax=Amphimedon queenslandica TaxID=400682 RepID=A2T568_AMPQE|nr:NADH dehydrogenase subunit 6 [Amphimedon queenslandica]ABI48998.1 NADH dehydrogenase subunit 6 [Amphimedon queenslandica]|eukprot:YP_001031209.1 NADH dehydrogenase subunit 6 (mitochondrion) [Amphimedon queenslandica]